MSTKIDVEALAVAYNKPLIFVQRLIEFYGIKSLPRYRTADDGLNDFYSDLTAFYDDTPSMTKQEFAEEVDINVLIKRYERTQDPMVFTFNQRSPVYGDFTSLPDSYHAALNYVIDTKEQFMRLDADLRARFQNDPQLFLDFVADPANDDELRKLGIKVAKEVVPAPVPETPSTEA